MSIFCKSTYCTSYKSEIISNQIFFVIHFVFVFAEKWNTRSLSYWHPKTCSTFSKILPLGKMAPSWSFSQVAWIGLIILHAMTQTLHALSFNITINESNDCTRPAQCTALPSNMSSCLGTKFTHTHTSFYLANDSTTLIEVQEKLMMWGGLRNVPKCWEIVQPFLCAVYLPKCENGRVELPSYDMCSIVQSPCRIVEVERGWPDFLRCNTENMPEQCDVPVSCFNS